MKQEYKKHTLYIIISVVLVFLISFVAGYLLSDKKEEKADSLPVISNTGATVEPQEKKILPYYMVRADESSISMYYVKDGTEEAIRTAEFMPEVFPNGDVSMLFEGIKTESGEEAISVWENFTS